MARLAKAPKTTATYTVVDIHNVSQSLVRQIEWLEQEIHASANRVVLLEDQDEAEELREDVQKKLTPLWNGALKLTLEGTDKRLVYAIERVRVPGLHRKDIVGARVSTEQRAKRTASSQLVASERSELDYERE